ncbi:VOC family protein [Thermocoleostomius sinensis]|uniref:VOC family protein n=1 Tax=Thermocoleostomius sinensis A174 TaxID=2016057 RepID=A0A9E8ZP43_9CYAN|nr:VOC family protein [Thermocoleostomius sinensis]WAL62186.1 VOC family protein [Thermocoleostomius sinensis A174]
MAHNAITTKRYHTITPHITVRNADAAIAFYKAAFGAEEMYRMAAPNGNGIWYAELKIGDSFIFLNDEYPDADMGGISPNTLGGSPVILHLEVDDVDAWFERAVRTGASIAMPLENMFWGDRYGKLVDPFGHQWSLASPIEPLTPEHRQSLNWMTSDSSSVEKG